MISIIIPTPNEADAPPRLLGDLAQEGGARLSPALAVSLRTVAVNRPAPHVLVVPIFVVGTASPRG